MGFSLPWAIGLNIRKIIEDIFICGTETEEIHTVATMVRGFFGISESIYMSLPCYINAFGIKGWVPIELIRDEEKKFQEAAKRVIELQSKLLIYRK